MRFLVLAPFLLLSCFVGLSDEQLPPSLVDLIDSFIKYFIEPFIQQTIKLIETRIQKKGSIQISGFHQKINNKNPHIEGEIGFSMLNISGLGGLVADEKNFQFSLNKGILFFSGNLSIKDTLKIVIKDYTVNMNIFDLLPLLGDGDIMLSATDLYFAVSSNIDFTGKAVQLSDFYLRPDVKGLGFYITGFWESKELSELITVIVSLIETIIVGLWHANVDCLSCILSISIEGTVNDILNNTKKNDLFQLEEPKFLNCGDACKLNKQESLSTIISQKTSELIEMISTNDNVREYIDNKMYLL